MTDYSGLLRKLMECEVEFIVIGGVAANAHGSARFTLDVDVVYSRTDENFKRLAAALSSISPYLRGAPAGLPFRFDVPTIKSGLNFTLTSTMGSIDLLGEVSGLGSYEDIYPGSQVRTIFGIEVRMVSLQQLIAAKRAAGRPKDFEAIAELEALHEEGAE